MAQACRTKNGDGSLNNGNTNGAYVVHTGQDLAQCQQLCFQNRECTGVEHNPTANYCEVWTMPILATADVPDYNCYMVKGIPTLAGAC
jgi:hypothetical protein